MGRNKCNGHVNGELRFCGDKDVAYGKLWGQSCLGIKTLCGQGWRHMETMGMGKNTWVFPNHSRVYYFIKLLIRTRCELDLTCEN